jgi:hypothetical protein
MKRKLIKACIEIAIDQNNPIDHPQYNHFVHWSFMIQDNRVISIGVNRAGNPINPIYNSKDFSKIHSESEMHRKSKHFYDNRMPFEVVNIRLGKDNQLKDSRPCICCNAFLSNIGCSRVYYSTMNGNFSVINY